ncbi:hypothetical protein ACJ41O_009396 [Fusarium nematophilum]
MDRQLLQANGIFFEEDPAESAVLPSHVESVRDTLLEFASTIPHRCSCEVDEDLKGIENTVGLTVAERTRAVAAVEECEKVKGRASRLNPRGDRGHWKRNFQELFLEPLKRQAMINPDTFGLMARTELYLDSFKDEKSLPWTLFGPGQDFRPRDDLQEPKPDWVAHFPIHGFSGKPRDIWDSCPRSSITENFSRATLEHLASHGLQPSATGVIQNGRRKAVLTQDYVCFPWLIVENMKAGDTDEFCYARAANAGMAAVAMLRNLAKHGRTYDTHVPPVVTLTTTGSVVRVWLMYSANSPGVHCIWAGNLTQMIDVLYLKAILDNCRIWASRVLKPWISSQIDLWKQQCPDDCSDPFEATLRRRKEPASGGIDGDNESRIEGTKGHETLRKLLREEHDRLLRGLQLEKRKVATRSMGTQTDEDLRNPPSKTNPGARDVTPLGRKTWSAFNFPTEAHLGFQYLPSRKPAPGKSPRRPAPTSQPTTSTFTFSPSVKIPVTRPQPEKASAWGGTGTILFQAPKTDIFKHKKKLNGKDRFVMVKLPNVSSEEILASKPWLRADIERQAKGKGKEPKRGFLTKEEEGRLKESVGEAVRATNDLVSPPSWNFEDVVADQKRAPELGETSSLRAHDGSEDESRALLLEPDPKPKPEFSFNTPIESKKDLPIRQPENESEKKVKIKVETKSGCSSPKPAQEEQDVSSPVNPGSADAPLAKLPPTPTKPSIFKAKDPTKKEDADRERQKIDPRPNVLQLGASSLTKPPTSPKPAASTTSSDPKTAPKPAVESIFTTQKAATPSTLGSIFAEKAAKATSTTKPPTQQAKPEPFRFDTTKFNFGPASNPPNVIAVPQIFGSKSSSTAGASSSIFGAKAGGGGESARPKEGTQAKKSLPVFGEGWLFGGGVGSTKSAEAKEPEKSPPKKDSKIEKGPLVGTDSEPSDGPRSKKLFVFRKDPKPGTQGRPARSDAEGADKAQGSGGPNGGDDPYFAGSELDDEDEIWEEAVLGRKYMTGPE